LRSRAGAVWWSGRGLGPAESEITAAMRAPVKYRASSVIFALPAASVRDRCAQARGRVRAEIVRLPALEAELSSVKTSENRRQTWRRDLDETLTALSGPHSLPRPRYS